MKESLDVRSIQMPEVFWRALAKLAKRLLHLDGHDEFRVIELTLAYPAVFGQLTQVTYDDWEAVVRMHTKVVRSSLHDFMQTLAHITPWTPVCPACEEFPLMSRGGVVSTLEADALCPLCKSATVQLVPIQLRRVHWVTGELIDPMIEEDLHSRPGFRIPLTDERIRDWAGQVDEVLETVLEQFDISLYQFLAHINLTLGKLPQPEDAAKLLRNPGAYQALSAVGHSPGRNRLFIKVIQREKWNIPQPTIPYTQMDRLYPVCRRGKEKILLIDTIGQGAKSVVMRGCVMGARASMVVIKVLTSTEDQDLLVSEYNTLVHLSKSDESGSELFKQTVPEDVWMGKLQFEDGTERQALIYRDAHGFDWTLRDVCREYPEGVDPRHVVWIGKRVLLALSWLHDSGIMHGALLPEHLLIHPVDHAVYLRDFSYAGPPGAHLDVLPAGVDVYAHGLEKKQSTGRDVAMVCRCLIEVLGGHASDGFIPRSVPEPLAQFLRTHAQYDGSGPMTVNTMLALHMELNVVAQQVYGPRTYVELQLPNPHRGGN